MGMDSFLFAVENNKEITDDNAIEIGYWRKNYFIDDCFSQYSSNSNRNGGYTPISKDMLNKIISYSLNFYEDSTDSIIMDLAETIASAKEYIDKGYKIYYYCSW